MTSGSQLILARGGFLPGGDGVLAAVVVLTVISAIVCLFATRASRRK